MPLATGTEDVAGSGRPGSRSSDGIGTTDWRESCMPVEEARSTSSAWLRMFLAFAGMTVAVMAACVRFGTEPITYADIVRIVLAEFSGTSAEPTAVWPAAVILLEVRLPRVLLSGLVGGSLAAVGVALQALLRNPLADPYVLGISSGAAFGAGLAVLLGIGTTLWAVSSLPAFAFCGGLVALVLVYRIARMDSRLPVTVLLLAGVIINAIFSALLMFLTSIMEPTRSAGMMAWLMGTLTAPTYGALGVLALYLGIGGIMLVWLARPLDVLALGEQTARSLGVEVEEVKRHVFVVSALMTGAVVSVSGVIGFVGMLVPHALRMVLGADHRFLIVAAFFTGAMFLMVADTLARTVLSPAEVPVGVVTALAGGPFFLYLLIARKRGMVS